MLQDEDANRRFLISIASYSFTTRLFVFAGVAVVLWDWSEWVLSFGTCGTDIAGVICFEREVILSSSIG